MPCVFVQNIWSTTHLCCTWTKRKKCFYKECYCFSSWSSLSWFCLDWRLPFTLCLSGSLSLHILWVRKHPEQDNCEWRRKRKEEVHKNRIKDPQPVVIIRREKLLCLKGIQVIWCTSLSCPLLFSLSLQGIREKGNRDLSRIWSHPCSWKNWSQGV